MYRKRQVFFLLIICIFTLLLFMPSILSRLKSTFQTPTNCQCSNVTIPPDIVTYAYGTVYAEMTNSQLLTETFASTLTMTATNTPYVTETFWRDEPVSTSVSTAYKFIDIYGIEDLPQPIGQEIDLNYEYSQELAQKIVVFMGDNNIQNPFYGENYYVNQMFLVDLDGDGKTEKVVSYTFQNKGVLYGIPSYGLGVAVLRGETVIAATPPEIRMYPETHLVPIQISNNKVGLLYHITTTSGGSGIQPHIYRKIFSLQNTTLRTIWEWEYFGGARAGAAYRQFTNEKIEIKYLTGRPYADIVISRQSEGWQLTSNNPANYLNYALHFPGGVVFSWNGEEYELSYYYDDEKLIPIRPVDLITHAPYISNSENFLPDNLEIMKLIEYNNALKGFGEGIQSRSVGVGDYLTTWDENNLYINITSFLHDFKKEVSIIWVGIDANLEEDFNEHTLSEDDYLFKIEPFEGKCENAKFAELMRPYYHKIPLKTETASDGRICILRFVIPRALIKLDNPLVKQTGWVLKHDGEYPSLSLHEYFPKSGKVIGFAVFSQDDPDIVLQAQELRDWFHPLPFNPQDPTTWGTLIFMSDQ